MLAPKRTVPACRAATAASGCARGSEAPVLSHTREGAVRSASRAATARSGYARVVLLLAAALAARAAILDRIAVSVGNQVITESDVIQELRIDAFLDKQPVDLSGAQKRKAAARLVDQTLILREASFRRVPLPSAEDAARLLEQVKRQYPAEADYRAALERYRIGEPDLLNHLLSGLGAMRFTDLRFRPEVEISPQDVREYYDRLAQADPSRVSTFEASRDEIEKLLTDQRVAQALDRWLETQRNQTEILYREAAFK